MIPPGPHTDWPWPFSRIPRRWTAIESAHPPIKLLGTAPANANLDIPPLGRWVITWPPYIAVLTLSHWHARLGIRYDYNGKYYQLIAFTIKRIV